MDSAEDLIDVHELALAAADGLGSAGVRLHVEPLPLVLGNSAQLREELRHRLRALAAGGALPAEPVVAISGTVVPGRPQTLAVRFSIGTRAESMHLPLAGATPLN